MFKKILVAVDGSKSSFKAMDKAIELQKTHGHRDLSDLCLQASQPV